MSALTQVRDGLFAKVAMHAVRRLALQTFEHMHRLSLRFHLERKTGGLTRVLERGRAGIEAAIADAVEAILAAGFRKTPATDAEQELERHRIALADAFCFHRTLTMNELVDWAAKFYTWQAEWRAERDKAQAELAASRTPATDEQTITVPRPHIPYGPEGIPADEADANYLRKAADDLAVHYRCFGSNLRATVVKLMNDAADAIATRAPVTPDTGQREHTGTEWGVRGPDGRLTPMRNRTDAEAFQAGFPAASVVCRYVGMWQELEPEYPEVGGAGVPFDAAIPATDPLDTTAAQAPAASEQPHPAIVSVHTASGNPEAGEPYRYWWRHGELIPASPAAVRTAASEDTPASDIEGRIFEVLVFYVPAKDTQRITNAILANLPSTDPVAPPANETIAALTDTEETKP